MMARCYWLRMVPVIAALMFFSACTSQPPLYNYEDYSSRYYIHVKEPSEETALNLQKSMEQAIDAAGESRSGRVPPGMYANLGYIYLKEGASAKAVEMFRREKAIYPEATHFMDRMIQKVELAEGRSQ